MTWLMSIVRWAANPSAYDGDHVSELSSYVLRIETCLYGGSVLVKDLSTEDCVYFGAW